MNPSLEAVMRRLTRGGTGRRSALWRATAVVVAGASLGLAAGCGAPQIGRDEEAFTSVDALYTAVSLRDAALVAGCEARLQRLRDAGKLPAAAASALESIIAETRAQNWEPAQKHLARFMKGQRR